MKRTVDGMGLDCGGLSLLAALALAAACSGSGSDQAAAPDAATDVAADVAADASPPEKPDPLSDMAGAVSVLEHVDSDGKLTGSAVAVRFESAAGEVPETLVKEAGGCRYYKAAAMKECDPPCKDWTEYCGMDAACHPFPQRVDAGVVTVSGLKPGTFTATPEDTFWYTVVPDAGGDLFDKDSLVTVSTTGGDVPAFEVTVPGVGTNVVDWPVNYTLADGKDNEFAWEVQGDQATVELIIQTGWHGAPPTAIIWCAAPDAAGKIVVPQEMIEMFPPAGGIGLFQHPCWFQRVSRVLVDTPFGPASVSVTSQLGFSIEHNM